MTFPSSPDGLRDKQRDTGTIRPAETESAGTMKLPLDVRERLERIVIQLVQAATRYSDDAALQYELRSLADQISVVLDE